MRRLPVTSRFVLVTLEGKSVLLAKNDFAISRFQEGKGRFSGYSA